MDPRKISLSLFLLRISVFLVMFMWTIDKLMRPEHAATVFQKFYMIPNFGPYAFYIIGAIECVILLGFLAGLRKKMTYGLVLVFHTISTLSTYKQYLAPFEGINLLFFAAWPMLAACLVLYILRDLDTRFTLG